MYNVLCSNGCMVFHDSDINNIPVPRNPTTMRELLEKYRHNAIVLFEGGADINPSRYNEENTHSYFSDYRDNHEFRLWENALALHIPMLGICRGHQLMNVAAGGSLWQDIGSQRGSNHGGSHRIELINDEKFQNLMSSFENRDGWYEQTIENIVWVNSLHHQGVKDIAPDAIPIAVHADGLNEGLRYPYGISVQWHPELMHHNAFIPFMFEEFVHA